MDSIPETSKTSKDHNNMKKILFILCSLSTFAFMACDEASYEVHQTFFYPQSQSGLTMYADQTFDTTNVYSIDPWTAEAKGGWFTMTPQQGNAVSFTHITLNTTVNNTGKNRSGSIVVKAHDELSMMVTQVQWLNVMVPSPRFDYDVPFEDRKPVYEGDADDDEHIKKIMFHVYQDDATLESQVDWLQPETAVFKKGTHEVKVKVLSNPNEEERKGGLTLTSGGITADITVIQAKQVNEDKEK